MNAINKKIRRNELCPCDSGRKYKRCCGSYRAGSLSQQPEADRRRVAQRVLAEHEANETRRRQQQGLGRPIISTEFAGHRIVAVGNALHWSPQWNTFHDFLFDYIKQVFGHDWGALEERRPLKKRHVLLRWAHEIGELRRSVKAKTPSAATLTIPTTPVLSAYLGLAHNLYLLKHNAKLQRVLIERLKCPDESSFHGAYYETFVAATFIKAGYEIDFEDEQDGSATHCEFVASSAKTSRKFSVEAKARFRGSVSPDVDPSALKLGVRDKIPAALQKRANHTRVIFLDVNLPEIHAENKKPFWVDEAIAESRDLENTMLASGQTTPTAYVIITNSPYQFSNPSGVSAVMEGFNIPEFRTGAQFADLRAALEARARHADIHHVFETIRTHLDIPSTFGGEMPEIHFAPEDEAIAPLQIGMRYGIPGPDGKEIVAELENAVVQEKEKTAVGIYRRLDNGYRIIAHCPLTDRELKAYQKHPTTFFGTVDQNAKRKCETVFDWYDFFFESYAGTSREKLLEFMKDANDFEQLNKMSQKELAKTFCERLAQGVSKHR